MDWSMLIGSSSAWPGSSSCRSGCSLLSALSVGGPLTPPRSVAPPSSSSPLVSRTCGICQFLRSDSSTFRFSVVGPSLCVGMGLGLGLAPTSVLPCRGRFSASRVFIGGSGCSAGFSTLWCVLCLGLAFSVGLGWLAIVECLGVASPSQYCVPFSYITICMPVFGVGVSFWFG